MPRCFDCHWFENAPPSGRRSKPCADLGELAQSESCDNFVEKLIDKPAPALPRKPVTPVEAGNIIGALMHEEYRTIFGEVIAEGFVLEQDADLALKNIRAQLETQGANIALEGNEYKRIADKLIYLYKTYRLILAVGLGRYADEIMAQEIANRYKVHDDSKPQKLVLAR
jgi:hypothetical protein